MLFSFSHCHAAGPKVLCVVLAGIRWLKQHSLLHLGHAENGVPWARFSGMLYLGDVELPQSGGVMYTFRIM